MDFEEELTCSICTNKFDQSLRVPRVLPSCGHTLCTCCLKDILQGSFEPRCPWDKTTLPNNEAGSLDPFPINFTLKRMLQGQSEREICEEHNEEMRLMCLTEGLKICDHCAFDGKHRNHEIQPIKKIKMEAEGQKRDVEAKLDKIEECYHNSKEGLESHKIIFLDTVKQKFQKLQHLLAQKEMDIMFEVGSTFIQESGRLDRFIGPSSCLKLQLQNKQFGLESLFQNKGFSKLKSEDLALDTPGLLGTLDDICKGWKADFEEVKRSFEKPLVTLQETINSLSFIEYGLSDKLKSYYPPEFTNEAQKVTSSSSSSPKCASSQISTEAENSITSTFKINTVFDFEVHGRSLMIVTRKGQPQDTELNKEDWSGVTKVKFQLGKYTLKKQDKNALEYVWESLEDRVTGLKVRFVKKEISSASLINLLPLLLKKVKTLEKIDIDLGQCKVSDQAFGNLIEFYISQAANLKRLSLDLSFSSITNKGLESFVKYGVDILRPIIWFKLDLKMAKINDEVLINLFTAMPNVKNFRFGLAGTDVSDKAIEAFVEKTLITMEAIETMEISLEETKVTDQSIVNFFQHLKNLKKLFLHFNYTDLTDAVVEEFAKNTFRRLDSLKVLEMEFVGTGVTEKGIADLNEIKSQMKKEDGGKSVFEVINIPDSPNGLLKIE